MWLSANHWLSACSTFSGEQKGLFLEVDVLRVEKNMKSPKALLSGFVTRVVWAKRRMLVPITLMSVLKCKYSLTSCCGLFNNWQPYSFCSIIKIEGIFRTCSLLNSFFFFFWASLMQQRKLLGSLDFICKVSKGQFPNIFLVWKRNAKSLWLLKGYELLISLPWKAERGG